jgi:hypothetical protein
VAGFLVLFVLGDGVLAGVGVLGVGVGVGVILDSDKEDSPYKDISSNISLYLGSLLFVLLDNPFFAVFVYIGFTFSYKVSVSSQTFLGCWVAGFLKYLWIFFSINIA